MKKTKNEYLGLRKSIGSQNNVAKQLNVSRCTLSRRENGKQKLTSEAYLALVGLYYLSVGEDDGNKPRVIVNNNP